MGPLTFLFLVNSAFVQEELPLTISPPQCSLYFSPDQTRRFAEYLLRDGDYLRAGGEFERYMIMTGATDDQNLLFTIGRCYLLGNSLERARKYLVRVKGKLKEQATFEIAKSYYQEGKYQQSLNYIKSTDYSYEESFRILTIKNYLFLSKFREARTLVQQKPTGTQLDRVTLSTAHLPYRSQAVAGLLSAVVPGLGKGYAGRWADGLFSFLVVSITGWQSYDGFHREGKGSAKGWVYGLLCFGFYSGNIWGSLVAANQHNKRIEEEILKKVALLDSLSPTEIEQP